MDQLRNTTLVFLVKQSGGNVTDICLAMKKRGFGVGRWNGSGGKVNEPIESVEVAAKREVGEEIGVVIRDLKKMAELSFFFPHNKKWNQMVHVFFALDWKNEPSPSEEMFPRWFKTMDIPYSEMWPDDIFWLPKVLGGEKLKAKFVFGENDTLMSQAIEILGEGDEF